MYRDSAGLYDLFSAHKDYRSAAGELTSLIQRFAPHATTLLDVACGTGGHLQHLAAGFEAEGLDSSAEMLDIARERCPETTFHHADMERFELDRCFDVVTCLFGSIGYTRTAQRMAQAIGRLALHLNTDGLLILEPWLTPEAYRPGEITADFIDLPELKACRMYLAELEQDASRFDIEYLVADRDGTRRFSETHLLGLIRHDAYCNACQDAGLTIVLDDGNLFGYGLIAAVRSA